MKVARVYALGDSLVAGTYDSKGGWCDRLKQDMHRITLESTDGTKRQMYNLGVGGETSRGLAARVKSELAARHQAAWPAVVIICTGKNDSRLVDGNPEVTPEEYEQNLRSIISNAQRVTDKIIFVGLGPCAQEVISFKQYTYTRQRLAEYNQIATKVMSELGVTKVDVYQLLLERASEAFYRDQLHPNDVGYQIIYETVKPYLLKALAEA